MNRSYQTWILSGLITSGLVLGGCASLEDYHYHNVNRLRASTAWKQAKACIPKAQANKNFAYGFKEGYYTIATGGSSCPPITTPPCYWAAKYQSAAGQCEVNQWYQGFQAGVIAAERDGRSIWTKVPTQDGPGLAEPIMELPVGVDSIETVSDPIISNS